MTRIRSTLSALAVVVGAALGVGACGTHGASDRTSDSSIQKAVDASLTARSGAATSDSVRSGMADSGGMRTAADSANRKKGRDSTTRPKRR